MEILELKANVRTTTGNGPAHKLRRSGQVPAVLYGPKAETVLLSVNTGDLDQVLKKGRINQLILNMVIQNGKTFTKSAMIKELQVHPVSRNFLHVDFYEIDMDRKIRVKVPVITTGVSKGVELGGMLQIIRRELEVMCFPMEMPESIEIDVSDLDIGDSIHVGGMPAKGGIEFLDEQNFTVITILSPKVEEEEEEEEVEEGEVTEEGAEEKTDSAEKE